VFTNKPLKGETEVGHEGAVCTVTLVERQEAQCVRMSRTLLKFGDGPGASYAAVVTVTSST
jgi:hypothetical protein